MLETQFPSSPLEDEGLSEDAIRSMSQLIHTTSMVAAKAIITSGQIGGVGFDPDRQASFGTIRCPKVRLARYQEVSLHFYWHGSHQAIHESRAWNSATWPSLPDPDVAYHLKIDEQLGNGGLYWQTNIASAPNKMVSTNDLTTAFLLLIFAGYLIVDFFSMDFDFFGSINPEANLVPFNP